MGLQSQRVASANSLRGDLFVSIHHDLVPDNLKETWQYEGKKLSYSDRFSGYAIFVSNDNADRAASLAFGHSLGQELQKRGLRYTPHYTLRSRSTRMSGADGGPPLPAAMDRRRDAVAWPPGSCPRWSQWSVRVGERNPRGMTER